MPVKYRRDGSVERVEFSRSNTPEEIAAAKRYLDNRAAWALREATQAQERARARNRQNALEATRVRTDLAGDRTRRLLEEAARRWLGDPDLSERQMARWLTDTFDLSAETIRKKITRPG